VVVTDLALKELRITFGLTQVEAANSVCVPLRTYIRYESNPVESNLKYQKFVELLKDKYEITETKGIYALDKLKIILLNVIEKYEEEISFGYLFGSYAKGYAKDESDVDICINTTLTGFRFVGLVENLHQVLKKKVDVIRFNDLKDNLELINEIMKDGLKIYG
jgi:predicted nucleotidyltransferase/DNA-binding XRE family transcriptional regulator